MGFDAHERGVVDGEARASVLQDAVKKSFKPEFVNRIDEVVQFRPLTVSDCQSIARLQLREMAGYLERTGVTLRFTGALEKHLAQLGWSAEYGARELRRHIRDEVENPLTEHLIGGRFKRGDTIAIGVRSSGKVSMTRARAPGSSPRPRARRADRNSEKGAA
jgi:ATP-dependent Clp protease ATP-binding subunit ClpC